MLDSVRRPLLSEALQSVNLLADLAGLEQYVAESYDARSFVELLQNADDAGAKRFTIQQIGNLLLVANDGREFTRDDFQSLCRSASSSKVRGDSIGYRGIGFKSVVGLADRVYLYSGELTAAFSRELTQDALGTTFRVPLVRIPHEIPQSDFARIEPNVSILRTAGYRTVFVFDAVASLAISTEFQTFDPSSMLFLRSVEEVTLHLEGGNCTFSAVRERTSNGDLMVQLGTPDTYERWITSGNGQATISFMEDKQGPVRLDEKRAVAHAFLPTHEATGFAFKINGDLSTDPSRTRVVHDDRTNQCIKTIAKIYVDRLLETLKMPLDLRSEKVLAALVPHLDPRMAAFQKRNLATELLASIKIAATGSFEDMRYRPRWINGADYDRLSTSPVPRFLPAALDRVDGLYRLLAFLGAQEATHQELLPNLSRVEPSYQGAAEITSHLSSRAAVDPSASMSIEPDWRLLPINGKLVTVKEANESSIGLDDSFVDMVVEARGSATELRHFLSKIAGKSAADRLVRETVTPPGAKGAPAYDSANKANKGQSRVGIATKKWRSAEQQVADVLEKEGWRVEDVSKQNVGYDVLALKPDGSRLCVEVKSITRAGEEFSLTTNEEGVARHEAGEYAIALVRQGPSRLEIAFIKDPISKLDLTRQCRQWVWLCSDYDFKPTFYDYE